MKIADIRGTVFIDTNILIYAYTDTRFTPACEALLDKTRSGEIQGYVNSTVIDEFFHKVLLMEVFSQKGLVPPDAIVYLKRNPDQVGRFTLPFTVTREILHDYPITVLDTAPVLEKALAMSQHYGLLFSDALHAACCSHYAIDHLVTNDRDFSRLDGLSVIAP
jgi:predicted nucleic acid-binding protein